MQHDAIAAPYVALCIVLLLYNVITMYHVGHTYCVMYTSLWTICHIDIPTYKPQHIEYNKTL